MGYGTCQACEGQFVWALVTTKAGKVSRMPLDPAPRPDGNIAVYRDHLGTLRGRTLGKDGVPEPYEKRAVSHFATCPHADRFRRRANGLPANVIPLRRDAR